MSTKVMKENKREGVVGFQCNEDVKNRLWEQAWRKRKRLSQLLRDYTLECLERDEENGKEL